jgi:cellulose synthase/poly-beta-1,6-N-acetylglucosamine synthase-like glycosyltransferase
MDHITTAQAALFIALGLMLYSYMGYPIFLWLLSLFRNKASSSERDSTPWPEVSIVISAHNEESVIGRRIENLLDLDYPPDRIQILLGSDGSTDRTGEIIRRYRTAKIAFHDFSLQRGKANVLNDLVARARGEYVVFTDANTFFDRRAIKELIRGFRRVSSACAVVGRLEFRTAEDTVNPDSVYWRYETMLKRLESRFGTVLGANGAIYAIKRMRFRPLPAGTIVDDFLIPMLMRLEKGGSVIFRPSAKAWETVPETIRDEFRRRVRIGAGDAHALRHTWRLLLPGQGMLAVSYWSHKVLRWMGPWLLMVAFASNLWLVDFPWARALLGAQVSAYALGFAAPLLRKVPVIGRMANGAWYFMVLNAALLIGTIKFLAGRAAPVWKATPRTAEILQMARAHSSQVKAVSGSQEDRSTA